MSLTLPDSVYVVPVTAALGFTRTQFTMVFSIRSMVQLVCNLLYGRLYRRFRTKPLIVAGAVLLVLGYAMYAKAASLAMFYLAAFLVGVATSLISASSMTIILNSWFDRSAGLIFGVVFAGSSIGGAALSSLMGSMIQRVGYANSYLFTAALAAVSSLPILLLAQERPGGHQEAGSAGALKASAFFTSRSIQTALALCFVIGLTIYPIEASISANLTDRGFPPEFGANMLGAVLLISAIGKILLGMIYDRRGMRAVVLFGSGCSIAGAMLFIVMQSRWTAYLFALIFGLAVANITTIAPLLARTVIPAESYGAYIGIFTAVLAAGNTIGFTMMSAAFDASGTYTWIVAVQIFLTLSAAFIFCKTSQ